MKLAIILIFIMTFSYVQSGYNLLAFGDIGEVKVFKKRNYGKLFKKQKKAKVPMPKILSSVKTPLKDEHFTFSGNRCTMKIKGKVVNRRKRGFVNFRKVLCASTNYIRNSDQITILGDMIYAENKFLPVKNTNIINAHVQKHYEKRTRCGLLWFRDMMKNYRRYCPNGKKSAQRKLWSRSSNRLHRRFYIIEGNHAFDVNYRNVSASLYKMSVARGLYVGSSSKSPRHVQSHDLHLYPRLLKVKKNGVRIQFLDLNTHIFSLLMDGVKGAVRTPKQYLKFAKKLNASKIPPYKVALNYLKYSFRAIRMFSPRAHWRVIRSHHPPMNIQGSFNEQTQYWTVKYRGKSLFDLLKENNVKVWLASHHHSAHVMAFPFNHFSNLTKKKFTAAKNHIKANCIYHSPSVFTSNAKTSKVNTKCPASAPHYKLQDNFRSNKSGYLWILVAGNSGREIRQMEASTKTRATLIWGRAVPKNYGAMNIIFSRNTIRATFFEAAKSGRAKDVARFTFRNVKKSRHYKVIDNEVTSKLK